MFNQMFNKYLQSGTGQSSMRLALIWSLILSTFVILVICFYIVFNTITSGTIEWMGISAFITGLTTFFASAVYGKVRQKKIENGNNYMQPQQQLLMDQK